MTDSRKTPALLPAIRRRAAFTLIEALAAVVVLAIIAGASLPVIHGMVSNAAAAQQTRDVAESGAYAMERIVRLLRDCPPGVMAGRIGLTAATPTSVTFADGRGLRLDGTTLMLISGPANEAVLARNVSAFELGYVGNDGVSSTLTDPTATDRFTVQLGVGEFELRAAAFPRVKAVSP